MSMALQQMLSTSTSSPSGNIVLGFHAQIDMLFGSRRWHSMAPLGCMEACLGHGSQARVQYEAELSSEIIQLSTVQGRKAAVNLNAQQIWKNNEHIVMRDEAIWPGCSSILVLAVLPVEWAFYCGRCCCTGAAAEKLLSI